MAFSMAALLAYSTVSKQVVMWVEWWADAMVATMVVTTAVS